MNPPDPTQTPPDQPASQPPPAPQSPDVRDEHREEMRLNTVISRVLVVGLLTAVALLVVGAILTLARPGVAVLHATSVRDIPRELAAGEPGGFFQLGLIFLLATPFARVVALGVAFGRQRRWLFTTISVVVATLLIAGAVLGLTLG
jgi:uncharacterized membrane protein